MSILLLCALGFAPMSDSPGETPAQIVDRVTRDLKSAKALRISYTVAGARHGFVLIDPDALKNVLDTITVARAEPGLQLALDPFCQVTFVLPDGKLMELSFQDSRHLDQSFWGLIDLGDDRLYDALCELASAREGRPIDILKINAAK